MATPVEEYIQSNLPYAQETSKKYGVPVQTILAAGGVESGWGKSVVGNNHFGIKGTGTANTKDAQTGQPINQRTYNNAQESFDDYGKFLTENKRYKSAFEHSNDPKAFAAEVAKAGYSERPEEYAKTLDNTIDTVNKVLGGTQQSTNYTPLPAAAKDDMVAAGFDPTKYQKSLNEAIGKGGESKFDAYKSLYGTYDRTATPSQQAINNFYAASTDNAPVVKTVQHAGDDFHSAFSNSFTDFWGDIKEAGIGLEHAVGLTSEDEFAKQTKAIQKDQAYQKLQISENGQKDPFSRLPNGDINWNGLAAGAGGLVGGFGTLAPAIVIGGVVTALSGGADIPVFLGLSAGELSAMAATSATLATQEYGGGYEEGLKRGLTNDQAATYGAMRSVGGGLVGAIPGGYLSRKLFGTEALELTDKALDQWLEKGASNEALSDVMPELTDGLKAAAKRRLLQTGKNVLEEGAVLGGVMGTQTALDRIATVQYAQIANQEDKFRDVLDKTNEEVFKDVFKSAATGSLIGGMFGLGTMLKSAAHPTLYGYVEANAEKPEQLQKLKGFIKDYGDKTNKPDVAAKLSSDVDEMQHVATTYGKLVKSPDARFQIFKLGDESKQVAADSEHALAEKEKLQDPKVDQLVVKDDIANWDKIIALNGEKQQLINQYKEQIGTTKKPIDYAEYTKQSKIINDKIEAVLKKEPSATESPEVKTAEPDPFTQQQPEVKQEEPETDLDKVFGTDKAVAPKTVKDVLDVPITMGGTNGFLSMREDGGIDFTSNSGKVYPFESKEQAEKTLARPFSELGIEAKDVDQLQLKQKMQTEQSASKPPKPKKIKKEKVVDTEISEALKEPTDGNTTGIADNTAAGLTELDKDAISEADQLIQGISEVGGAENEAKTDGVENGATENRPVDETLGEDAPRTPAEGETTTESAPVENKTEHKSTEGTEQVKEGDGNEVVSESELSTEPTVITIKSEDSKRTVEVKIKKKAKEANAKAEEKGISLKEQKDDLVGKMQQAIDIIGKDATEVTPEAEADLEKAGIKVSKKNSAIIEDAKREVGEATERVRGAKSAKELNSANHDVKFWTDKVAQFEKENEPSALTFDIKGDGQVRVSISGLPDTLEMTKKEFPENEKNPPVKFGKGSGGKLKPLGNYDTLAKAKQSLQDAQDNLESAKKLGNKAQIETYEKQLALDKGAYDSYVGEHESNVARVAEIEKKIKDGKIKDAYDVKQMLELPKLKEEIARYEGKEYTPEKPNFQLAKKVLKAELDKVEAEHKISAEPHLKKDGGIKSSIPEATKRNLNSQINEIANLKTALEAVNKEQIPENRYQKESPTGGKPIESATVKLLDRVLKKAFPNIKTSFLTGEEFEAKHGTDALGVVNRDGTVDINSSRVTASTQVHEMGHVWTSWAKKFAPDLYKRGMELAEQEKGIHEAIKADGYDLEGTALHEETLARMIGESGESLLKDLKEPSTLSEKAKAWVGEMWQKLTNYVKNRLGLKDTRFDNIKDMPFKDFAAAIARELVSGKEISPISSEEVAGIEKDGVSRFQLTDQEDREVFAKPTGHIGIPLTESSAISRGLGVMRKFREILGNEKNVTVTEDHVTKAVEFLGNKLHEYSDRILKNPDGSDKNLAGSAWIKQLAKEATTEKFRTAVREVLEEQAATGKRKRTGAEFDPVNLMAEFAAGETDKTRFQYGNLSKDSQRIISTLGSFEVLSDRIELTKDRLFYNNGVVAFDPEADKVQTNKFVDFHRKLYNAANKNKWTRKAYKAATEYFLNAADQGTWAYMLDGNGDGMYSRGFRSYEKGVSAAFRIKQAASALIKPLTDISNEGLKSTLNKSAGATTKEVFTDNPFMPDMKLTNGELNSMYGILQAKDVQAVLNSEDGAGLADIKPIGIKLRIQEFGDERKAQTITVYKKDFEDLKAHLGQERINKIAESATKTAEYLHTKENPVHESTTGLSIPQVQTEEDGTNFYYPRLNVAGNEHDLENYTKKQSYINDLTALKARDPKDENLYLVQEPAKVWDSRIRQGSEYAEMVLPTHNMDVLMGYGKENMLNLDMNRYIDYNNKFQHDLANPDTSGSPIEKYIMSHFALATIGVNPFVNAKHLSTIPLASGVIPMKYLAKNLAAAPKTYAEQVRNYDIFSGENKHASPTIDEMKEHSDFANARINGFTSEVQLEAAGVEGKIRVPNGLKDGKFTYTEISAKDAMIPLKTAETSFGAVVWGGAKDMVKSEFPHLQEGTPEYWNQVDRLYTDAIVASQPSFDQIHRPLYTKGGFSSNPRGVINKTLSLFAGQIFAAFNFGTKKGVDLLNNPTPKAKFEFAKAATNIFVANALLVAGVNMVRQKTIGSDKDKTTYGQNVAKSFAGEFPIFGPIMESLVSKYQNGIYGQQLDYPSVGVLNETIKGTVDAIKGKEDKAVRELGTVGAQLMGVPTVPFKLAAAGVEKLSE